MQTPQADTSHAHRLERLTDAVRVHRERLSTVELGGCVDSDLSSVDRVLGRIQASGLARGTAFCEWGSGLGGVCGAASLNGFQTVGIEIQAELVLAARTIAHDLDLDMEFSEGSFLLPGDEDLSPLADAHTRQSYDSSAWARAGLAPEDCDVVFAYPWPGEEAFVDRVFSRHAQSDGLLMTFHDFDRVFVQRKQRGQAELLPVGWM